MNKLLFTASIIIGLATSCSINNNLEEDVIQSMELSNRENGIDGIEIESLTLNKQSENSYSGILVTLEYGGKWQYNVEVVTEGQMFEWQILDEGASVVDYNESYSNVDNSNKSTTSDMCDLSNQEFFDYLVSTSFNINGNGSVVFSKTFDYASDSWKEGYFTIIGNGSRVQGVYSIVGSNQVYIDNVIAVSGNYDASNNRGSSGYFELNCDGDLKGSLSDGSNRSNYTFYSE